MSLILNAFSQNEWLLIHPSISLSDLQDSYFISDHEGWAVGTQGTILYTIDGGETWETQHNDIGESFWSVFFIDENEGWVVGWSEIYHTSNKGETWELQERPIVYGSLTDVFFINADTGWIVGTYRIVLKTTNGGENWDVISNIIAGNNCFFSVSFIDEMVGCAVGGKMSNEDGFIMATVDGGLTWTETTPDSTSRLESIIFKESSTGWACGINGGLYSTLDGGNTWVDRKFSNSYFRDIHFFDSLNGLLLRPNDVILTFDGGDTWDSVVTIGINANLVSFSSANSESGYAVGYDGSVCITQNMGSSWENLNEDIGNINQIGFLNPEYGYALTYEANSTNLMSTNNGGYTWQPDTIIENGPFFYMKIEGQSIYLINGSSQLIKSTNSGYDWELLNVPDTMSTYFDLQFLDEDIGYICGSDGILFRTNDGGNTWIDKSLSGDFLLFGMVFINPELGLLIDPVARIVIRTEDGGTTWEYMELGEVENYQPASIFFVNDSLGFITTFEGLFFKTNDAGSTWNFLADFPPGNLSKVFFINETEGWYKNSNEIYHTYDGGETWTEPQLFGNNDLRDMFFLENQGWLGGLNGLVANTSFFVDIANVENRNSSIKIFPNPVNSNMVVSLNDASEKILVVEILNLQGQQLKYFSYLSGNNTMKFDVSTLVDGTYIVHVVTSKNEVFHKVIIK